MMHRFNHVHRKCANIFSFRYSHVIAGNNGGSNLARPSGYRRIASTPSSSGGGASSSSSSEETLVSWSVNGNVGTIELHSQRTFNALTVEMGQQFRTLIHQLEVELNDPKSHYSNIQAIVLRGEGDKAFSAGGNLEWLHGLHHNSVHTNVDIMLQFYTSFLCMRQRIPVPIVGAIHGPAMGAGACLALACDLRVVAGPDDDNNNNNTTTTPILGFPFSKLGIPSGMGGLFLLQHAAGLSTVQANEILFLGKSLTGPEADRLGLVNRLVPKDRVKDEAYNLALEITKKHPVAIRSMVRSCRLEQDKGLMDALYRDAHAQAMCYARLDWGRGLKAVAQKTEANFDDYHSK